MMYQKKKFNFGYIPEEKIRVLELPYDGRELSMIILLPDDTEEDSTGLQKVTHLSQCSCSVFLSLAIQNESLGEPMFSGHQIYLVYF